MATATKQTVPAVEVVKSVTLVLSRAEASTLAVICGRIGGDYQTSPRKHSSNVREALLNIGVGCEGSPEWLIVDEENSYSSIYFRSYPEKGAID